MRLKLLTMNIEANVNNNRGYLGYITTMWKNIFPHSNRPMYELGDYIKHEKIDIATFNEIDGGSFRTKHISQLKIISQLSGLAHHCFHPTYIVGKLVNQGDGVVSRFPIHHREYYRLHGRHARYLDHVILDVEGRKVHLLVTHLSLGKKNRQAEIREIAQLITHIKGPMLLTGDFNTDRNDELHLLEEFGLKRVEHELTFPSWKPRRDIDHIYVSNEFSIKEVFVCPLLISDHRGVVAELELE